MINKAILLGRLGKEPELKHMTNGESICTFSLATYKIYKDQKGENQQKTEWHRVICYKPFAEPCGKYLKKGQLVYVEGEIRARSWEDQNRGKQTITEIVASNIRFLEKVEREEKREEETPPIPPQTKESDFNYNEIPF